MRRVLFLSYYTPPRPGVATARTRQLRRYLPEFGWEVTIVTARLDGASPDVVQTDYVDVQTTLKRIVGLGNGGAHAALGTVPAAIADRPTFRQRLVRFGYDATRVPDPQIGWFGHGRRAVKKLLASGQFDVVLSSSPPFTTNMILASIPLPVPWVADFRDLWSETAAHVGLRTVLDGMLERWTLRSVTAVTTVSDPNAGVLRRHRPSTPAHVVPNAFDPEEWERIPFVTQPRCTLLHAGQMFGGLRDPRPLFRAIRSLIDAKAIGRDELVVELYCVPEGWLSKMIASFQLEDVVQVKGAVPRLEVMAAERHADRLLIFLWDGTNTEGILTGKLFEYLGARRPILALGGPERSSVDEVLAITRAGVRCRNEEHIAAEIAHAVAEHRVAVREIDPSAVRDYDARAMAAKMARVLDEAASTSPH